MTEWSALFGSLPNFSTLTVQKVLYGNETQKDREISCTEYGWWGRLAWAWEWKDWVTPWVTFPHTPAPDPTPHNFPTSLHYFPEFDQKLKTLIRSETAKKSKEKHTHWNSGMKYQSQT